MKEDGGWGLGAGLPGVARRGECVAFVCALWSLGTVEMGMRGIEDWGAAQEGEPSFTSTLPYHRTVDDPAFFKRNKARHIEQQRLDVLEKEATARGKERTMARTRAGLGEPKRFEDTVRAQQHAQDVEAVHALE